MHYRIFLLALCLMALGHVVAQDNPLDLKVSINVSDQSLESILIDLVEGQGAAIIFRNDQIPPQRISIQLDEVPLARALEVLLNNRGLDYRLIGGLIVIEPQAVIKPAQKHSISGFITDADTGERLIGATVVDLNSQKGTYSDEYGFFSLSLPEGDVDLRFSYTGYSSTAIGADLKTGQNLEVSLRPTLTLPQVFVTPTKEPLPIGFGPGPFSGHIIDMDVVNKLPSVGGEPDIFNGLRLLPGVQTGADGLEGLHVRGGDGGQNLVLIDGVPIYDVNHAIGLFSIFNPSAIRQATFYRGGFPSRYGGRLSSILDVRTKEGNLKEIHGSVGLGLLSFRAQLEGPIVKDRTAFFISGRQSFINAYFPDFTRQIKEERGEDGETRYGFNDFNFKLHHIISKKDVIYLSLYKGSDDYNDVNRRVDELTITSGQIESDFIFQQSFQERIRWGNTAASIRWNHVFNSKLVANTSLTFSELDASSSSFQEDTLVVNRTGAKIPKPLLTDFRSGIRDFGLLLDFHYIPSEKIDTRFGINAAYRDFRPGTEYISEPEEVYSPESADTITISPINNRELSFYLEQIWRPKNNIEIYLGARLNATITDEDFVYWRPQPRLGLSWKPQASLTLHVNLDRMVQFAQVLSTSAISLPTDLWVPTTDEIEPADSWQISGGFNWRFNEYFSLDLNLYHKRMSNLLVLDESGDIGSNWRENVESGSGLGRGIEMLWGYKKGRIEGQFAYTLAQSTRRFAGINNGNSFPAKYDRRHDLKLWMSYQLRPWLNFSANWILNSGFAFSLPSQRYSYFDDVQGSVEVFVFDNKNGNRMPANHRLDINFRAHWGKSTLKHHLNLGIYNVYNRINPVFVDLRARYDTTVDGEFSSRPELVELWLMELLPSVGYSLSF